MNKLFSIQKSFLQILIVLLFFCIFFYFVFKYFQSNVEKKITKVLKETQIDIINPKFTINTKGEGITISANEGHFLNDNEVLLKKNVKFFSEDFNIESDDVIFNKKNMTASSKNSSKFISGKATILSSGFEIIDNGNKINFNGKSKIIIK